MICFSCKSMHDGDVKLKFYSYSYVDAEGLHLLVLVILKYLSS